VEDAIEAESGDETGDVPAASSEAPMEEMLSGLGRAELEAELAAPNASPSTSPEPAPAPVIPLKGVASSSAREPAAESALSLSVVGALKLKLELTGPSQTIQIEVQDASLRVELSDGSEFRIPLNKAA
jgi:hypothetical protein